MNSVTKIVLARGGWDALKRTPIKIVVTGYMPLCIEWIGKGPRGGMLVSVAHYYQQNGDALRDPDYVAEVMPTGEWLPYSFQQDGLGIYQEVIGENGTVNAKLARDLEEFANGMWSNNLEEQGFVKAALNS